MRALWLTALAIFVVDRATKWIVVEAMDLKSRYLIDVAPGFVTFKMAWNTGVNFGVFASDAPEARYVLAGIALAVSVGVAIWAMKRGDRWFSFGGGAVIGGAIGNAWDRIEYGAVADFLNVTCCGIRNPFAFNVADIAIFAGAALLVVAPTPDSGERRA